MNFYLFSVPILVSKCQYTMHFVPQRRRKLQKTIKKYLVMNARKKRSKGKNKTTTNSETGEVWGFQSTTLTSCFHHPLFPCLITIL